MSRQNETLLVVTTRLEIFRSGLDPDGTVLLVRPAAEEPDHPEGLAHRHRPVVTLKRLQKVSPNYFLVSIVQNIFFLRQEGWVETNPSNIGIYPTDIRINSR